MVKYRNDMKAGSVECNQKYINGNMTKSYGIEDQSNTNLYNQSRRQPHFTKTLYEYNFV